MTFITFLGNFFILKLGISLSILLIINGILVLILLFLPKKINVKIHNFTLIYTLVLVYFGGYILGFLILRIIYINRELDLKKFIVFIDHAFNETLHYSLGMKVLFVIGAILLLLIWMLLFIIIRTFLSRKCWQLHLYWYHVHYATLELTMPKFKTKPYFYKNHKYYYFYHKRIQQFNFYYSLQATHMWLLSWIQHLSKVIKPKIQLTTYRKLLRYGTLAILLIIFVSECIWNNWLLHYTIYYLLFYIIFVLWYRLSFALFYQDLILDRIIFERAYCEPEIYYVNLTEKEEFELENYIRKPYDYSTRTPISECLQTSFDFLHPIQIHKRFILTEIAPNKFAWANDLRTPEKTIYFEQEDLKTINNKHFVKKTMIKMKL